MSDFTHTCRHGTFHNEYCPECLEISHPTPPTASAADQVIDRWRKFGGIHRTVECPVSIGRYRPGDSLGPSDVVDILIEAHSSLTAQLARAEAEKASIAAECKAAKERMWECGKAADEAKRKLREAKERAFEECQHLAATMADRYANENWNEDYRKNFRDLAAAIRKLKP